MKPGRELVNKDKPVSDRDLESVFMQYNRKADGSLENLPSASRGHWVGFVRLMVRP